MKRLAALVALAAAAPASAHAGHEHSIGWTLDLSVTAPLLLAAVLYAAGFVRLRRRGEEQRQHTDDDGQRRSLRAVEERPVRADLVVERPGQRRAGEAGPRPQLHQGVRAPHANLGSQ